MKICLVSEYFYPQSSGGTEKYVFELAKKLISEKNLVQILTAGPIELENYEYEGIPVKVIRKTENLSSFKSLLRTERYDRVHFHTLTPTFDNNHIALANETNAQVYFTAHIPSVTCIHGDLMQFGKVACDGLILKHRCTACYLSKKNIHDGVSRLLAFAISQTQYPKSIAQVVDKKLKEVATINRLCHKIFIFTDWQRRIFIKNGFDKEKLVQIQQMEVPLATKPPYLPAISKDGGKLKLGFVGRITYEKGLHVLLDAFQSSHTDNLELHIAAITQDRDASYFQKLINQSKGKSNVVWKFNLDQSAIQLFYQTVDLICIPSVWYETGPYVLYEAFKYELPVIANNLGDMAVWKKKGYGIELYNNLDDLKNLLNTINVGTKINK